MTDNDTARGEGVSMRSIVFIAAMLIMSSASAQIAVIDDRPALDPGDRQLFTEALNRAMVRETGSVSEWRDAASQNHGQVLAGEDYQRENSLCRSFDHTVFVGEQVWSYNGIACREADGTWQEVGSRSNAQFVESTESKEASSRPTSRPKARSSASSGATEVHLVREAGTFRVPVLINGVIELNFTLDSGASDVLIPADVVMTLLRTGTLKESDFLGTKTYVLADGSTVPSATFRIRMLKVGDRTIENVIGAVADVTGSLLLGQSFLSKFNSWSVDNSRQVLVLD
jgi:surface antigen/predicted aspartyl protease